MISYEPVQHFPAPKFMTAQDHKRSFVGEKVDEVLKTLGKPHDELSGAYIYRYRSSRQRVKATILFFCYDFHDKVCTEIRIVFQ